MPKAVLFKAAPAPAPKPKPLPTPAPNHDIQPGDHVYVQHASRGALAVNVKAIGKHGFKGDCQEGKRHNCPWDSYLGHKARGMQQFGVVEQGADGALVEDAAGKRRYVAGELPEDPEAAKATEAASNPAEKDDPLLGRTSELRKADMTAAEVKAAGLPALESRTFRGLRVRIENKAGTTRSGKDKGGKAWSSTMKHDYGYILGTEGVDGDNFDCLIGPDADATTAFVVTTMAPPEFSKVDEQKALLGFADEKAARAAFAAMYDNPGFLGSMKAMPMDEFEAKVMETRRKPGLLKALWMMLKGDRTGLALQSVTDKAGHQTKRWKRTAPEETKAKRPAAKEDAAPEHGAPLQHGDAVAFRHGDVGGSGKIVASGADGVTVKDKAGDEHQVRHEHLVPPGGTEPAKEPAKDGGPAPTPAPAKSANPKPLFAPDALKDVPAVAAQPAKTKESLFALAPEALDHLEEWLDRDKGVCSRLGIETMKCGPGEADFAKPGGMLFIGKLKGEARAAEKVESDYGGDWSQLLDVVRCSIAVDSYDDLSGLLAELDKSGLKLARQPKDRFAKPLPVGYRDALLNVTLPNGMVAEVQFHVKPMLEAKNAGHKHYETQRVLEAKAMDGTDLTPDEANAMKQAKSAQVEIYNQAWAAAMKGAEGTPMEKAMSGGEGEFSYFDHEGAKFRRRERGLDSVDDVLHGKQWKPYKGDRLKPGLFGDRIEDPLMKAEPLAKAVLFIAR